MAITWKKVITTADDSTYLNTNVTNATVIGKVLTGLSTAAGGAVAATDSLVVGMGKLEKRVALNDLKTTDGGQTTNATHTGEVTGSGELTIANDVIVNANINSAAAIAYSKLNLTGELVNADLGLEEIKSTNFNGIAATPTVGHYFKAAASGTFTSAALPTTITSSQASAITTNSTHSASTHAPSGAEANVSGNSGNAAVYDNSGTPTLKTGITQAEMRTAIGAGTSSLAIGTSNTTAMAGNTAVGENNVSGNSGNAAIYDNSGTPTLKSGITQAEMATALGYEAGADVNVSGDSGNSAIYDNSGTPTLKSGITQAEMQTAIGGTYTDNDVSVANLKTALAGPFASNLCTIGGASDTITIGDNLKVTGDLVVEGDTVTTNVTTIQTEDKSITLADHASPTTTTGTASGIDVMTSATATEHPYVHWSNAGELTGWIAKNHDGNKGELSTMNFHATAGPVDGASGTVAQGVGSFWFEKDAGSLYVRVL